LLAWAAKWPTARFAEVAGPQTLTVRSEILFGIRYNQSRMVVFGGQDGGGPGTIPIDCDDLARVCGHRFADCISDLTIEPDGIVPLIAAAVSFVLIGAICARSGMPRLQAATECFGFGVLVGIPIALSTYLAVRVGFPLRDDMLAGIDAPPGFDWQRTIGFVDTHPAIAAISNIPYRTFSYQVIFWPVALSILGYCARAYITVAAFAILCLLSMEIDSLKKQSLLRQRILRRRKG